jgi:hypothetical protein
MRTEAIETITDFFDEIQPVSIGRTVSRALCPACAKVSRILHRNERGHWFLACSHSRTTGLLPSEPGYIGLEHIIKGTSAAAKFWPPCLEEFDRTEAKRIQRLMEEADRIAAKEGLK